MNLVIIMLLLCWHALSTSSSLGDGDKVKIASPWGYRLALRQGKLKLTKRGSKFILEKYGNESYYIRAPNGEYIKGASLGSSYFRTSPSKSSSTRFYLVKSSKGTYSLKSMGYGTYLESSIKKLSWEKNPNSAALQWMIQKTKWSKRNPFKGVSSMDIHVNGDIKLVVKKKKSLPRPKKSRAETAYFKSLYTNYYLKSDNGNVTQGSTKSSKTKWVLRKVSGDYFNVKDYRGQYLQGASSSKSPWFSYWKNGESGQWKFVNHSGKWQLQNRKYKTNLRAWPDSKKIDMCTWWDTWEKWKLEQ